MKVGFLTACLPNAPLESLIEFAHGEGFQTLEVAVWPIVNTRDYSGSSIDVANLTPAEGDRINRLFEDRGMEISAFAYYDNNLHQDKDLRAHYHAHLRKVIDAAQTMGVAQVGTFVGRDVTRSIPDNLDEFERVFPALVQYAEDRNVQLMIENCPMEGWHPEGHPGQIAYSPEVWAEMFRRIPSKNFGLNLDPSHLYWLGIDYLAVVSEFRDRLFHVHAKDTEILPGLKRYGIYGKQVGKASGWDSGWWRYRLPGLGEIDWKRFIATLSENGYDGPISIEHEDPVWEGSEEKVKRGLKLGRRHLAQWVV